MRAANSYTCLYNGGCYHVYTIWWGADGEVRHLCIDYNGECKTLWPVVDEFKLIQQHETNDETKSELLEALIIASEKLHSLTENAEWYPANYLMKIDEVIAKATGEKEVQP